jgi:hypothetical protein
LKGQILEFQTYEPDNINKKFARVMMRNLGESRVSNKQNCQNQKEACSRTPHSHIKFLVAQDQQEGSQLDDEIIKKMFKELNLSLPTLEPNSPPVYESTLPDMFDFGKLLKICYKALAIKKLS